MFQILNRWFFRKSTRRLVKPREKKYLGSGGQIAIILLIIIGILLMLVAVAMNLGRISMSQVNLQIAADSTAGLLASNIASYAEAEYRSVIYPDKRIMGGEGEKTRLTHYQPTPVWSYIIKAVLAIIAVALCVLIPPLAPALGPAIITAFMTTASTAIAVHIHNTQVAPAYNRLWAGQYANLPIADQFQRMATNTAFQMSVGDPVTVPDERDYDMDGFFVGDDLDHLPADRTTSRLAVTLTRGVPEIPADKVQAMEKAMQKLASVLFSKSAMDDPDPGGSGPIDIFPEYLLGHFSQHSNIGLFDHDGLKGQIDYSDDLEESSFLECAQDNRCNPHCLPPGSTGRLNAIHGSFVENFGPCPGWNQANETCGPERPWCLAGDPFYENPDNTFRSIREKLGHDDENQFLYGVADMGQQDEGHVNFSDPYFSMQGATGIFRLFWKKYLMDLSDQKCHWKTPDHPNCDNGRGQWQWKNVGGPWPYFIPEEINCATEPGLCAVHDMLDALEQPANLTNDMPSIEEMCFYWPDSDDEEDPPAGAEFFLWKPGSHRYQAQDGSPKPPYDKAMDKDCATTDPFCEPNCQTMESPPEGQYCHQYDCFGFVDLSDENPEDGEAFPDDCNKAEFRDDAFNELLHGTYGIDHFIREAYQMLKLPPLVLLRNITVWYPGFAIWSQEVDRWYELLTQWHDDYPHEFWDGSSNPEKFCMFEIGAGPKINQMRTCLQAKQETYAKCLTQGCNGSTFSACEEVLDDFQEILGGWFWENFSLEQGSSANPCSSNAIFRQTIYLYHEMFRHRAEFLGNYLSIYSEISAARLDLNQVIAQIKSIVGEFKDLYDFMQSGAWSKEDKAIYAWKEWPDGPQEPGFWQVVRVDTRLPTRCSDQCYRPPSIKPPGASLSLNPGPNPDEPRMPHIVRWERSNTAWFSLVDFQGKGFCKGDRFNQISRSNAPLYGLEEWDVDKCRGRCSKGASCCGDWMLRSARTCFQGGITAARIQRWEEPRRGGAFAWATQVEFWRQIFQRPGTSFVEPKIDVRCQDMINEYGSVFMTEKGQGEICWNHLNALLATGAERTACADYYYREAWGEVDRSKAQRTSQFGVRFAPCHAGILGTFTAD